MLEFRVLGPLEVRRDGRSVEVRGSKRRAVLALLVLQANEIVRTDLLIDALWGEHQPANASAALQSHISRLRKDLGEDVLVTKPWGYVLRAPSASIDLRRFEQLVDEARPLPARERTEMLGAALSLWHGGALADLAGEPSLSADCARLEELRQSVVEQRIDAQLELGEHEQVIPTLEGLVAAHPLRERLRGQLILALYRAGRQAEALETYRETRRVLVEELAIEPSPELRELERAILRQDPALAPGPPSEGADEPPPPGRSRWRWPRSPLVIGAATVLMFAGVAAAIVATTRGGLLHKSAAAPVAPAPPSTTKAVAAAHPPSVAAEKPDEGNRPGSKPPRPHQATTQAQPRPAATPPRSSSNDASTEKIASEPPAEGSAPPPTRPPPPPPRLPPPRPAPILTEDNFNGGVIDPSMWDTAVVGTGVHMEEQSGRLEISIDADAPDQGIDAEINTRCRFENDFDVTVEYTLLDWPPSSGVLVYLGAQVNEGNRMAVSRESLAVDDGEGYVGFSPPPGWLRRRSSTDLHGVLRITRVRQTLRTYYKEGPRWLDLADFYPTLGAVGGIGPVWIKLSAYASEGTFGHQPVRVAFDNFRVSSGKRSCP